MRCVDVEEFLDDFVNGKLNFERLEKIELHLRECPFCRSDAEERQTANSLLKNLPLIAPSNQFDARMMQAFRNHQGNKLKPSFWTAFFANFSISKPALALSLLALIGASIFAFQLGRLTSPNSEIAETTATNQIKTAENDAPVRFIEKRIEIPVVKTVEIPVYKEKIVNRIIYRNRQILKTGSDPIKKETKIFETNSDLQNAAVTFVQNVKTFTPISLKNFQPLSEMKAKVIKRGNENED